MNTGLILEIAPGLQETSPTGSPVAYIIGGIVAILIMGYLVYTLLRPDKF